MQFASVKGTLMESKVAARKVLLVLDSQFKHWKGTQRFLYEFGSYLLLKGYEVALLENTNSELPDTLVEVDFVIPFRIIRASFKKFLGVFFVPKDTIRKEKPDVVYAVNVNSLPLIASSEYNTIFGTHVLNISELKYVGRSGRLRFNVKKIFFVLIVKLVWRKKDIMIHALNTDQRDWIVKVTKNRFPVRLIGNPVECRIDETTAYLNKMEKNDRFTVLYFGPFSPGRGFLEFLSIVKYMHRGSMNVSFNFIIGGDGPLRADANELLKIYDDVSLFIRPTDEQKRKLMLSSDLFVFPSINENFSIGSVEAQSCGLPCLFSDITPLKNIAIEGKTGYRLSLDDGFEKRFSDKITEYFQTWQNDYNKYVKMRIEIAEITRRLCKENVLPQLLDMVESFINKDRKSNA